MGVGESKDKQEELAPDDVMRQYMLVAGNDDYLANVSNSRTYTHSGEDSDLTIQATLSVQEVSMNPTGVPGNSQRFALKPLADHLSYSSLSSSSITLFYLIFC